MTVAIPSDFLAICEVECAGTLLIVGNTQILLTAIRASSTLLDESIHQQPCPHSHMQDCLKMHMRPVCKSSIEFDHYKHELSESTWSSNLDRDCLLNTRVSLYNLVSACHGETKTEVQLRFFCLIFGLKQMNKYRVNPVHRRVHPRYLLSCATCRGSLPCQVSK
jgi:hypothetical protein